MRKAKVDPPKCKIRSVEFIQRAESGGHPLDNEAASRHGMGHGMPVRIVCTRDVCGLLRAVLAADIRGGLSKELRRDVDDVLLVWDNFVTPPAWPPDDTDTFGVRTPDRA